MKNMKKGGFGFLGSAAISALVIAAIKYFKDKNDVKRQQS